MRKFVVLTGVRKGIFETAGWDNLLICFVDAVDKQHANRNALSRCADAEAYKRNVIMTVDVSSQDETDAVREELLTTLYNVRSQLANAMLEIPADGDPWIVKAFKFASETIKKHAPELVDKESSEES